MGSRRPSRTVAIPREVADRLAEHVAGKTANDLVFSPIRADGYLRHGNFYGRVFRPAVQRLVASGRWPKKTDGGVPLSSCRFHDLRHSAVSILIDEGVHPKAISEQMGHSSIMVTMDTYGDLFETAWDKVEEAFSRSFKRGKKAGRDATVTKLAR
jgi:integrase